MKHAAQSGSFVFLTKIGVILIPYHDISVPIIET